MPSSSPLTFTVFGAKTTVVEATFVIPPVEAPTSRWQTDYASQSPSVVETLGISSKPWLSTSQSCTNKVPSVLQDRSSNRTWPEGFFFYFHSLVSTQPAVRPLVWLRPPCVFECMAQEQAWPPASSRLLRHLLRSQSCPSWNWRVRVGAHLFP